MAIEGDTGLGGTCGFTTLSSFSPAYREIELPPLFELETIESDHLGNTDYAENQLADLSPAGVVKLVAIFDTADTLPGIGDTDTITVTFPQRSGESGAATYSGTGQFKKVGLPKLMRGELQMMEIEFQLNGDTGPAFTKST